MKKQLLAAFFMGLAASPALAANGCPSSDPASLSSFQDKLASQVASEEDDSSSTFGNVLSKLDSCFSEKRKVPACLHRTYDYAEQKYVTEEGKPVKAENELNMRRPPEELRAPDSPDDLVLFQKNPYKDAEQIAKEKGWPVVRYKSRHSGGFDGGTSSLMMIQVPGSKRTPPVDYDQYINIALPADDLDRQNAPQSQLNPVPSKNIPHPDQYSSGELLPSTTTIVTVRKGSRDQKPLVIFNKFDRPAGGGKFIGGAMGGAVSECYSCHPNGLRAISPLGFSVDAEQHANGQVFNDPMWKAIREMNNSMNANQKYTLPSWGEVRTPDGKIRPALNANGFGPVWGAVKPLTRKVVTKPDGTKTIEYPTRSKEYITGENGCAKRETTIEVPDIFGRAAGSNNIYNWDESKPMDWKKVAKAMNCASCHNNEVHGALTGQSSAGTIRFKILVDKSMPLWAHRNPAERASASDPAVQDSLNLNERIALYNCLNAEFRQDRSKIKEWLTEKSCTPRAATSSPANSSSDGTSGDAHSSDNQTEQAPAN